LISLLFIFMHWILTFIGVAPLVGLIELPRPYSVAISFRLTQHGDGEAVTWAATAIAIPEVKKMAKYMANQKKYL